MVLIKLRPNPTLRPSSVSSPSLLRTPVPLPGLHHQVAMRIARQSWSGALQRDVSGILTHYSKVDRETFPILALRLLDPEPDNKVRS